MIKPNLFIVGAMKAGTTSLHSILAKHQQTCMSLVKEPNYFCTDFHEIAMSPTYAPPPLSKSDLHQALIRDQDEYLGLFQCDENIKYAGESSVSYLASEVAAENIKEFSPEAKILIMIRNPIDRAVSHYNMDLAIGRVKKDFERAFFEDFHGLGRYWQKSMYFESGLYADSIRRYIKIFGDNVKIVKFEEFISNQKEIVSDVLDFLGLDFDGEVEGAENGAVKPVFPTLNYYFESIGLKRLLSLVVPKGVKENLKALYYRKGGEAKIGLISESCIKEMREMYKEDVEKLSSILDESLIHWVED